MSYTEVSLSLFSTIHASEEEHSHHHVTEAEYFAKESLKKKNKREAKHSSKLTKGYGMRHDVIVGLNTIDLIIDENKDFSMEELDQIYQHIYDRLPPQSNFGIGKAKMLENNTAKVTLSIPKSAEKLPLREDQFILGFGDHFTGGYDFDDTRGLHEYAKSDAWDKDSGIQALIVKFNGGKRFLEATLFFDSYDGYKETMSLIRGRPYSQEPIKLDSGQYAYALYLEANSIEYLESNEYIINIIPSPYDY